MEEERLHPTETGVPQGGVVSPVWLHVALHGMEHALGISSTPQGVLRGPYALGRYADALAVWGPTQAKAIAARERLRQWRKSRGRRLSDEKTPIRHLRDGCNVLACNIRQSPAPHSARSGYKLLIKPSPDAITDGKRTLQALWRQHVGSPTVALINEMTPVSRGWRNYFRVGVSKEVFNDVDGFMYTRAQRYMKRRHPRQSGWWRTEKYWGRTRGRQDRWGFQDKARHARLRQCAWAKIVRHRLVPTTYSPDDPTPQDYWRQRRAKPQGTEFRRRPLVQRQKGLCPVCPQHREKGEALHVHHVVAKTSGGKDALANLWLVHHTCPRQIHSSSAPLGVRRWLAPCTR